MVEPVRQHFQHKCWRERGYVFERFLSEPEQLAWHRTAGQLWVKNGYGGRSTGTSAVPQYFGAPRKSAGVTSTVDTGPR
jgi:hypothetical protein